MDLKNAFCNPQPQRAFIQIDDLKQAMQRQNRQGADFLLYLLEGNIKQGKGFWKSSNEQTRQAYLQLLQQFPHLQTENPFGYEFDPGDHFPVVVSDACLLDNEQKAQVQSFLQSGQKRILFAGGPAAKIAAVLASLHEQRAEVCFVVDRARFANESSSASYAHINHANALNADFENAGLGILPTLIKRNLFGESDPSQALVPGYRKVDFWLKNLRVRDIPIYLGNVLHGYIQQIKKYLGIPDEHFYSRLAGLKSMQLVHWLEEKTGIRLTLDNRRSRAFFAHFGYKEHLHSLKENQQLKKQLGLESRKLTREEIAFFYGESACGHLSSVDVFAQNDCFVHGFDQVIKQIAVKTGFDYRQGNKICEVFYDKQLKKVVAVLMQDTQSGQRHFLPISHLGLSLGPKAKYRYKHQQGFDAVSPVPHQTLATGVSCQVLFKITRPQAFHDFPFTGLQQTHFVEMARNQDFVLVKLTGGGNIADARYNRSYAINALANLLSVIQPDSGLEFVDVVCAWPCSRGINASNNGQLVRLADNCVVRFAEGGTGMTKMASNAQIMLDMLGLEHGLSAGLVCHWHEYRHTIIDHRQRTHKVLSRERCP